MSTSAHAEPPPPPATPATHIQRFIINALLADEDPRLVYEKLPAGRQAAWRATARTIESAYGAGQSALDAAKRLGTWYDVDHKTVWRPWDEQEERLRRKWMRQAYVGFCVLRGERPVACGLAND